MSRPTDFHESLRNLLAFSSKDWGATREDAWIYGIVFGWDPDPDDDPDDGSAMDELSAEHGWDESEVARLRLLHAQFEAAAPSSIERTAPAPQVWERHLVGTDVAETRLHLVVDATGRTSVHEAVLVQLLVDAGWECTA